ncbi:B2 protein-like [Tripterygium wilfordii]|uniref:B2 protein-like n=1 Tax=Tripterygium wilfordii TaxID=458696 RepID=A0A7J7C6M0_TRIWF|nr:B2 protein-like [Tripterygium wilfordii]KAF5729761.1 B2 protein-like [Tripterygium wilfordii]
MENNQQSFYQFSDQLRLRSSSLANLTLNDSIWSNSYSSKRPDERRNFDIRVGGEINNNSSSFNNLKPKGSDFNDFNGFNYDWKMGNNFGVNQINPIYPISPIGSQNSVGVGLNGGFNKGIYSNPINNYSFDLNLTSGKSKAEDDYGGKGGRKNKKKSEKDNNSENNKESKGDKRFKTLPPSESLPRNETIGGYIFVCSNDTMAENLKRQLFGLPPRYRDSVRAITPGLPLFLYNYSTHLLYGVFEAAGFGGTNIDPSAWEDKKCPGESRFPAQVRVVTRKICEPLEEDSFRPILHHYDGPKFRLELNIPEALSLLDVFEETSP